MERVVNIIGMGRSSANLPDTGENWGINFSYVYGKLDKLFFMDGISLQVQCAKDAEARFGVSFEEALAKNPAMELISNCDIENCIQKETGEFMMQDGMAALVHPFPLIKVVDLAPGCYFTSTAAYAIAYAILEKVDRIRLYGFEIWSGSDANEYRYQRPCIDFWLAFAMGRGIKVECPWYLVQTAGNNQNLYGYTTPSQVKGQV